MRVLYFHLCALYIGRKLECGIEFSITSVSCVSLGQEGKKVSMLSHVGDLVDSVALACGVCVFDSF